MARLRDDLLGVLLVIARYVVARRDSVLICMRGRGILVSAFVEFRGILRAGLAARPRLLDDGSHASRKPLA